LAELGLTPAYGASHKMYREPPRPASCGPTGGTFALVTNRAEPRELVEAEHRQHAVVELAIRDLKDQALAHFPPGSFNANPAWT